MSLLYEVPDNKKIRVIVDTDAACEADDGFAIAHALMSKKFEVKAILAEQFGGPETTRLSFEEIRRILDAMDLDVPVLMGEEGKLSELRENAISPAAQYLITEALREDVKPLYVLGLGAITNIAVAIQRCPEIINHMTVIWIGGQSLDHFVLGHREFNSGNDIDAINLVISSGCIGTKLWSIHSSRSTYY